MPSQLSPEEQRQLLEDRGIIFPQEQHEKDANKIQEIGYYRLKDLARPFSKVINGKIIYDNLKFSKLLVRYYEDKNLRIYVLHAIEDIEVNISNNVSTLLGNNHGPFGYLDFSRWADKKSMSKFKIEEKQYYFKKSLLKQTRRSNLVDIKVSSNKKDGFPTVWLMMNLMTLGKTVHIIKDMSENNRKKIAKNYNCRAIDFLSWIECINLVRNVCAHNSNLVDYKLETKPKLPREYKDYIYRTKGGYSNSLALILFIIKSLMNYVNPKYKFGNIFDTTRKLSLDNDLEAKKLGFSDCNAIKVLKTKKDFD